MKKDVRETAALASAVLAHEGKIRTPRIFEAICEQIRTQLSAGRLRPGDKLPAERELAQQFGSSRTAVREALRSLEIAGVIELRKGVKGGAFILEGDPAVVTRSIGDMVHLGRISLEGLTESRVIILDAVVRLACERGAEEDFDALDLSIDRTEELTRQQRYDERRVQLVNFYRLLAQATGNEVMGIIVDALTDIVLRIMQRDEILPRQETVRVHREIVQCLRRRDADRAASLMKHHLEALHGHLLRFARSRSPSGAGDGTVRTGLAPAVARRAKTVAPAPERTVAAARKKTSDAASKKASDTASKKTRDAASKKTSAAALAKTTRRKATRPV